MSASDAVKKLNKIVDQNTIDFDDLIVKTLDKSSNFSQLKDMSINTLISAAKNTVDQNQDISKIFTDTQSQQYQAEPERLSQYTDYDDLISKLPVVGSAVNTLVDNIITPDNNFNKIFKFTYLFGEITPNFKNIIQSCKTIISNNDIEQNVEQISQYLVKYGCYFAEIVETKKSLQKYKVLQDSDEKVKPKIDTFEKIFTLTESDDKIELHDFYEEYNELLESVLTEDAAPDNSDDDTAALDEIQLNIIHPKNVVVVYTGDLVLGYLVIVPTPGNVKPNEQLAKDVLNKLFQQSNIPNIKKLLKSNPEYESYISSLLFEYDKGISDIKTKFVPVSNMIHDYIGTFPYGDSRLESIRTLGKYAIVGNAANMLYRFTRAPDIRIFKVDVGLDHDSAKYIQQIKGELTQRKYAVDLSTDVTTLTKQLTQFEDLWVPTKQGQEFFSVDVLPSGDLQSKNDDLKFLQDQIISGLDTPPSYLGLERGEDSRYTLSQMNAKYAKTIQRLGKVVGRGVDRIIKTIYRKSIGTTPLLEQVSITLYPPTALIIERWAEIYGNVSTVMQSLEQLKLPKEYFLKELIPWLDTDELDDYEVDQKIQDIINQNKSGEGDEGGDGGGDLF